MTAGGSDAVLRVEEVACIRGDRLLFEGISFEVGAGGALRVSGPNGAGKSSLLRLLAGLLPAAAGRIERPAATAYLGHENALKLDARLGGELRFWAGLDGGAGDRLAAAVERFELAPLLDLPVRLLSNGQRRRAALARLAASGAVLWLMDEPEVGLDARSVERMEQAMAAHRAGGGMIVLATHATVDLPDAELLALEKPREDAIF